ncbi:unnamed protein product [Pseudo-nitzschia multistriata]|uniref:Uncharacterized protein n=1 Tax=Pseudo-nitzschia multistriata TaxID=183589 RepID=A0A448ZGA1_9STRA|nr:unnamed protein product [Pseudo-nitzschia multistriata]
MIKMTSITRMPLDSIELTLEKASKYAPAETPDHSMRVMTKMIGVVLAKMQVILDIINIIRMLTTVNLIGRSTSLLLIEKRKHGPQRG